MREYEILLMLKPHLGEEDTKKILDKFQGWIKKNEGEILVFNPLGVRDLYYEIKKMKQAFYLQCQFKGANKTLEILNAQLRVNENVLRYMIVTMDSIRPKNKIVEAVAVQEGS